MHFVTFVIFYEMGPVKETSKEEKRKDRQVKYTTSTSFNVVRYKFELSYNKLTLYDSRISIHTQLDVLIVVGCILMTFIAIKSNKKKDNLCMTHMTQAASHT